MENQSNASVHSRSEREENGANAEWNAENGGNEGLNDGNEQAPVLEQNLDRGADQRHPQPGRHRYNLRPRQNNLFYGLNPDESVESFQPHGGNRQQNQRQQAPIQNRGFLENVEMGNPLFAQDQLVEEIIENSHSGIRNEQIQHPFGLEIERYGRPIANSSPNTRMGSSHNEPHNSFENAEFEERRQFRARQLYENPRVFREQNFLLPFASAQLAKDKPQQQHHLPPVSTTNLKKSVETPEKPPEHHAKLPSERHHVKSLDSAKHNAKPKRHSRRKRMHCLSMLRKIGDPRSVSSLSDIVQRYREMTRH